MYIHRKPVTTTCTQSVTTCTQSVTTCTQSVTTCTQSIIHTENWHTLHSYN
jgi:hypothetical protein